MDSLCILQKKFNSFVADSIEEVKTIGRELDRLKKENERLVNANEQVLKENNVLTTKLLSRTCPNCDCFKNQAKAAHEKLKLVYKALSPILGGNGTQQQISHMLTQKFFPEVATIGPNSPAVKEDLPASNVKEDVAPEEESYLDIAWRTEDLDDGILDEVATSVEKQSQGRLCGESPVVIEETPERKNDWRASRIAERIICEILGPSQPAQDILATASETAPQICNERTPRKTPTVPPESPIFHIKRSPEEETPDLLPPRERSTLPSPIRVIGLDELRKPAVVPEQINTTSLLMSPSRRMLNSSSGRSPATPKRKRVSPRRKYSPRKTPTKKQATMLKKSHRIEAELSTTGVRRLTQTQLNVTCFKKPPSQENVQKAEAVWGKLSPVKTEEDDLVFDSPVNGPNKRRRSSPPLSDIGNSPDLEETNLSTSVVRRVASDVVRNVLNPVKKEDLLSTYDRLPEGDEDDVVLKKSDLRKKLPGQECPECVKFYEMFGDGDLEAKQRMMNQCSKHRTRKLVTCFTPPGFWKPMLSQTLTPGYHDESMQY